MKNNKLISFISLKEILIILVTFGVSFPAYGKNPSESDALTAKLSGDTTCSELAEFSRTHQPSSNLQVRHNHEFYIHLMTEDGRFPEKMAESQYWNILMMFQQECAERPNDPIGLTINDIAVKMGVFPS